MTESPKSPRLSGNCGRGTPSSVHDINLPEAIQFCSQDALRMHLWSYSYFIRPLYEQLGHCGLGYGAESTTFHRTYFYYSVCTAFRRSSFWVEKLPDSSVVLYGLACLISVLGVFLCVLCVLLYIFLSNCVSLCFYSCVGFILICLFNPAVKLQYSQ